MRWDSALDKICKHAACFYEGSKSTSSPTGLWNSWNKVFFQCLKVLQVCKMQKENHKIMFICRTDECLRECQNTVWLWIEEDQPWLAKGGQFAQGRMFCPGSCVLRG